MEAIVAPQSDLPAGVTEVGATAPPPIAPVTPDQLPIAPVNDTEIMADGGPVQKWNGLEILGGIIVTTIFIFAIAYYRVKTLVVDEEIKQHDSKIQNIQSDLSKIKNNGAA